MSTLHDWDGALAHLRRRDRALSRIIDIVGPRKPARLGSRQTPFATLLRSIVYQQLSGKAAGSIHRRLLDLFPGRRPSARALLALDDAELRAAGLSRSKVLAVRDLAAMLLIFTLDRPDVLPVTDLGIRRGFMVCRGAGELSEPAELLAHGEIWRPYRSIASWYLWRASEL